MALLSLFINLNAPLLNKSIKGTLHLWKDECVFKMGHLCWRNEIIL